jgi:hypothetical protein
MSELTQSYIMQAMVEVYRIPSITGYNRLEGSPRAQNFDRSLKAEVRDALWLLTRQWQFGEFRGEDAATPVLAEIVGNENIVDRVSFPGGQIFTYDKNIPLETKVEREKITPNLFISVQAGRYFLKLLRAKSIEVYDAKFALHYELNYIIDPNDTDGVQLYTAVKGRIPDGCKLLADISSGVYDAWIDNDVIFVDKPLLKEIGIIFKEWYGKFYSQPSDAKDTAWVTPQLEYNFNVATPNHHQRQTVLSADQYYEGHLDWYSFDLYNRKRLIANDIPDKNLAKENYVSFIPAPISFKGMPNPRFWQMEENQTDFGGINASTTGLLHILFAEFGLVYSNDWFMLPYPMQINTTCEMKNIVITDVFGQHTLIQPSGKGLESDWHRFVMFHHTEKENSWITHNLFYLAPAITKALESEPLEKVNFLRDEMANMVWAVENIVPSHSGKGVSGAELAAKDTGPEPFVPAGKAKIRYVLGTTVPDNWIPFIPVHINGNKTEIQLQRAQMPGAKGAQGVILTEKPAPFFINEEEVPRAGAIVQRSFQRTRWLNGKTFLWIGRYKEAGKGEGWSNLHFDQIEDIPGAGDEEEE